MTDVDADALTNLVRPPDFLPYLSYGSPYDFSIQGKISGYYVVSKRMVKKQQMRWSQRGARLLLQIRTRVLNGEWEATFRQWYPGFRAHTTPVMA